MKESKQRELFSLLAEFRAMGVTNPYVYTTRPTPAVTKIVFQDRVCLGYDEALAYVKGLLADATREQAERNQADR